MAWERILLDLVLKAMGVEWVVTEGASGTAEVVAGSPDGCTHLLAKL